MLPLGCRAADGFRVTGESETGIGEGCGSHERSWIKSSPGVPSARPGEGAPRDPRELPPGGRGRSWGPAQCHQRRLPEKGGGRGQGEETEGGGGRRAERLFVVRFDPEGEPETLTFLA